MNEIISPGTLWLRKTRDLLILENTVTEDDSLRRGRFEPQTIERPNSLFPFEKTIFIPASLSVITCESKCGLLDFKQR